MMTVVGRLKGACFVLLCLSIAHPGFDFLFGTSGTQLEAIHLEEKRTADSFAIQPSISTSTSTSTRNATAGINSSRNRSVIRSTVTGDGQQQQQQQEDTDTDTDRREVATDTPHNLRFGSSTLALQTDYSTVQKQIAGPPSHAMHSTQHAKELREGPIISRDLQSPKLKSNATQEYHGRNYFDLIQEGNFEQWAVAGNDNKLPPIELMRTYMRDYSQQALEQKWNECSSCASFQKMKFVVGRYSCPLEAGNRMFKFMNHLVWAIVTRRVFLWGHWDESSCRTEADAGELEAALYCDKMMNSVADCNEVLQLAKWVPSWDEWSVKLNLTTVRRACTIGNRAHDAAAFPMDGKKVPRVIRVGQQNNLELGLLLSQEPVPPELLHKPISRDRARALFGNRGVYFAYGMLFEALFTFHPSLLLPAEAASKRLATAPLVLDYKNMVNTYLLHSRHTSDEDDGSDISLDVLCMHKVIANRTGSTTKPCFVYTMSDRAATRESLPIAIAKFFNCTTVLSSSTTAATTASIIGGNLVSPRQEHGPFAGRGYFEDVALAVSNVRQGFMAPNKRSRTRVGIRTSSALPRSIIEFRRVLESPSADDAIPEFKECVVP